MSNPLREAASKNLGPLVFLSSSDLTPQDEADLDRGTYIRDDLDFVFFCQDADTDLAWWFYEAVGGARYGERNGIQHAARFFRGQERYLFWHNHA